MSYQIRFRPAAQRQLSKLPKDAQRRIAGAVELLKDNPRPPNAKLLKGKLKGLYRVRTGGYRIIYQIRDKLLVICIVAIGHRSSIYP